MEAFVIRAGKTTDFDITLISHHASGWMRAKEHASFYVNNGRPAPSVQHLQLCMILLPLEKNRIANDLQNQAASGKVLTSACSYRTHTNSSTSIQGPVKV